jgi:4-hydroxy-3-methylbut-2-en-1-yl diphosphate synthase IspG/GcpE
MRRQSPQAEAAHTVERVMELTQAMIDIVSTAINELPEAQKFPAVKRLRALVAERQAQMERAEPAMANVLTGFGS